MMDSFFCLPLSTVFYIGITEIKNYYDESFKIELWSILSQIDFSEGRDVYEMYEDFRITSTSVTDKYVSHKVKNA